MNKKFLYSDVDLIGQLSKSGKDTCVLISITEENILTVLDDRDIQNEQYPIRNSLDSVTYNHIDYQKGTHPSLGISL